MPILPSHIYNVITDSETHVKDIAHTYFASFFEEIGKKEDKNDTTYKVGHFWDIRFNAFLLHLPEKQI